MEEKLFFVPIKVPFYFEYRISNPPEAEMLKLFPSTFMIPCSVFCGSAFFDMFV